MTPEEAMSAFDTNNDSSLSWDELLGTWMTMTLDDHDDHDDHGRR